MRLFKTILFVSLPIAVVVAFAFYVGAMYEGQPIWTALMLLSIVISITLMVASIIEVRSVEVSYNNKFENRRNLL